MQTDLFSIKFFSTFAPALREKLSADMRFDILEKLFNYFEKSFCSFRKSSIFATRFGSDAVIATVGLKFPFRNSKKRFVPVVISCEVYLRSKTSRTIFKKKLKQPRIICSIRKGKIFYTTSIT